MAQYELAVDGMQCAGCEQIIESELKGVRGTVTVDASYKRSVVEVRADSGSRPEVEEAIRDLGYELRE